MIPLITHQMAHVQIVHAKVRKTVSNGKALTKHHQTRQCQSLLASLPVLGISAKISQESLVINPIPDMSRISPPIVLAKAEYVCQTDFGTSAFARLHSRVTLSPFSNVSLIVFSSIFIFRLLSYKLFWNSTLHIFETKYLSLGIAVDHQNRLSDLGYVLLLIFMRIILVFRFLLLPLHT